MRQRGSHRRLTDGIADTRLVNQGLTRPRHRRALEVVEWFGAVQAQEYEPAKWGLALRTQDDVDAEIERAFADGQILRTHVMRPTWHFVSAADIRWLLALTAPRVHRILSSYTRRQGIETRTLVRGTAVVERALGNRQYLTRTELGARLLRAGLPLAGLGLAFLTMYAELEGVICSGPRRGRQFTYALVAERAPDARPLSRDEALAELTRRYFRSHGPATIRDFVWWSGLPTVDARRGLEMNRARQEKAGSCVYWTIGPRSRSNHVSDAHLLPVYDEYLVAYRDREAVPHGPSVVMTSSGPRRFHHAMVIGGQVAGTWHAAQSAGAVSIAAAPLRPLTRREHRALADAVDRHSRYLEISDCRFQISD